MAGLEFFDAKIPCLAACPVHTNAGVYVAAIADGDDELAYLTARLPNPTLNIRVPNPDSYQGPLTGLEVDR